MVYIGKRVFTLIWIATLFSCFIFPKISFSQKDFSWWVKKHNWDGHTKWLDYITISPGLMGPNALPVPEIQKGILKSNPYLKVAGDVHFSKGDNTQNAYIEGSTPLFSDRVALKLWMVPIESFKMDTITRDLRKTRYLVPEGKAAGDLYIATYIQLIKENSKLPDVLVTINLKTATGGNLTQARFTDSPGYYFDLSVGKSKVLKESMLNSIRYFGMMGFYVWQLYSLNHRQNDAFLYGAGFELSFNRLSISNSIGGYIGYLDNGDKPAIYRLDLLSNFKSRIQCKFRFQQGINDFGYSTYRFGLIYNFSNILFKN